MKKSLPLVLALVGLAACQRDSGVTSPQTSAALSTSAVSASFDRTSRGVSGAVYTLTNQAVGNAVAIFQRGADGSLHSSGTVATGGTGTGAGLGSQGAVVLSDDGRWLFAVNAGSNDVSVFRVGPLGLALASRTASGGTAPSSVTAFGSLVYVLNSGGSGNITGFRLAPDGGLTKITGSTQPLSGPAVGPAEVAFSPDGRSLVVTEKGTSLIDVYSVRRNGAATGPTTTASAGATPYGFAFHDPDDLLVSEAAGSASSYDLRGDGALKVLSGAVLTHQAAPCWLVVTNDNRFAYVADAHAGVISAFNVSSRGALTLLDADGVTATVAIGNTDLAVSGNSRFLYQLDGGTIYAFQIQPDGHLSANGTVVGLPAGTVGLAAR